MINKIAYLLYSFITVFCLCFGIPLTIININKPGFVPWLIVGIVGVIFLLIGAGYIMIHNHEKLTQLTKQQMKERKQVINTERLTLRKFKEEDAEGVFNNWASDKEVTKYLTWTAHENIEQTKQILNKWIEDEKKPKTHRFVITEKDNIDNPIGGIDVVDYADGCPEIGYCLSRRYWNKGYMTEACKAFIEYLVDNGYKNILIRADANNIASIRVIEKCGFKFLHQEKKFDILKNDKPPIYINCYEIKR